MVKQNHSSKPAPSAGKKRNAVSRKRTGVMGKPALKQEPEFSTLAKRALAFRRAFLFLLTAALLTIGLLSVCGIRFF